MSSFREEQLLKFFSVLDGLLESPEQLFLIGGAAVVIGFHSDRMTKDVDTWMSIPKRIQDKWEAAVKLSGLSLHIEVAGVAEAAIGMEERALISLQLTNLTVLTPSALDLVLMKIPRFSDNDKTDIYKLMPFVEERQLCLIFKDEFLPYCMGSKKMVALNYLEVIEVVFGPVLADSHAKAISFESL